MSGQIDESSVNAEQPDVERLRELGLREARIQGVDPECARVYGEGWAQATEAAQARTDELEKQVLEAQRLERFADQHAADAEADRDEVRARLAQRDADVAQLKAARSTQYADLLAECGKQCDRLSASERQRQAVLELTGHHVDCARDCGALARGIQDLLKEQ